MLMKLEQNVCAMQDIICILPGQDARKLDVQLINTMPPNQMPLARFVLLAITDQTPIPVIHVNRIK
jgi:hypothetical protein